MYVYIPLASKSFDFILWGRTFHRRYTFRVYFANCSLIVFRSLILGHVFNFEKRRESSIISDVTDEQANQLALTTCKPLFFLESLFNHIHRIVGVYSWKWTSQKWQSLFLGKYGGVTI